MGNSLNHLGKRGLLGGMFGWRFAFFGSVICVAAGCQSDRRVSLGTFVEMTEQAATTQPATESGSWAPGPYQVGAGDVLRVLISGPGAEQLGIMPAAPPGVTAAGAATVAATSPGLLVRVDRNGGIVLPMVGRLDVAGKMLDEIATMIAAAYSPRYITEATVQVDVAMYHPTTVLVLGEVVRPGPVPLQRDQRSVLQAVLRAGGPTEFASDQVVLVSAADPRNKQIFNISSVEGLVDAAQLDRLGEQDIVWIGRRGNDYVYVQGLVGLSRSIPVPRGSSLTVLQAIAASGGLRTDVTPREATLIRRTSDGQDVHVKLNLDRVRSGDATNIQLAAGDILLVPETLETKVQDFINRNFFLRAGISATLTYNVSGIEFLNRRSQQVGDGGDGVSLSDVFDPFGALTRSTLLQNIAAQPAPAP